MEKNHVRLKPSLIVTKEWLLIFSIPKNKLIAIVLCLFLTSIALFCSFQFEHYKQTIGKITSVKQIDSAEQLDENGNTDTKTTQELQIQVLNNTYKDKSFILINEFTTSQINNHAYHKNDYVFIHVTETNKALSGNIIELKRDHFLIILIGIFVNLLILVTGKFGLLTFLSFIINGSLISGLLVLYRFTSSQLLVWLFMFTLPIMIALTLTLVNGWTLKTKITTVSTIIGSGITFLLGWIVISLFNHQGLHYEEMELVTRPPHVLFMSSLLIGSVGAVMDVSMTIVSSLLEVAHNNQSISPEDLKKAGQRIGEDIMGPMTNIMFFSYLSGSIPLVLIFLRNGMSFGYTFSIVLSLEFARALVGSIGIILAVPISIKVTQSLLTKEEEHEC
ncbi:YibE/F family protein [Vagococcus fluvialis]|nr:YibE/F family protein [Vagococcus fluvialis]NKD51268.1 YibE/F family protein [Vagococcus fluvialis]